MEDKEENYTTVYNDRIRPRSRTLSVQQGHGYHINFNPYYASNVAPGQERVEYYRQKAKLASARINVKDRSCGVVTEHLGFCPGVSDFRQRTTSFSSYFQRRREQSVMMEDTEQFWNKYSRIHHSRYSAFGIKIRQFLHSII